MHGRSIQLLGLLLLAAGCAEEVDRDSPGSDSVSPRDGTATDDASRPRDGGGGGDAPASTDGSNPGGQPTIGDCTVFPSGLPSDTDLRAFNADISGLPVHPDSDAIVAWIGADTELHRDFGSGDNGIPLTVVAAGEPLVEVRFLDFGDESDPGPEGWITADESTRYPIPGSAAVESGSDRHVLVADTGRCQLFELFDAEWTGSRWDAAGGAVFDLRTGALRPIGWTSADAAGLPMIPGLVRYEEVAAGRIEHALRFTVRATRRAFILPATHMTSTGSDPEMAPMGMRFRLKASVDISGFSTVNRVILTALKRFGMFVADNGADWFLSGAPNPAWDDDDLSNLNQIKGSDFEVVDTGPIETSYP